MAIVSQIVQATVLSASGKARRAEQEVKTALQALLDANSDPKNIKLAPLMDTFSQTRLLLTQMGVQEGYYTLASNPYYK